MIDFKKPVQTGLGRPVSILTTNGRGPFPVVGYIGDGVALFSWSKTGLFSSVPNQDLDLINVPEKRTAYVNIVNGAKRVRLYRTAQEAASAFDQDGPLIARVKIEYTEGQRDE